MQLIAKVIVFSPLRKRFDYLVPAHLQPIIALGQRVRVSFGRRQVVAIVHQLATETMVENGKLKPIIELIDRQPLLTNKQLVFLTWLSNYYQHPMGEVFSAALPKPLRQAKKLKSINNVHYQLTQLNCQQHCFKRAPKQWQLIELLQTYPEGLSQQQILAHGSSTATIAALMVKNVINKVEPKPLQKTPQTLPVPNQHQQQAIDAIVASHHTFRVFLLYGVTGSGKTNVYLHVLNQLLSQQQQALIIVPEINLTPQTTARFQQYLSLTTAVYHSNVSDGERAQLWQAVKNNTVNVVIGTRSSLFLPWQDCRCIVVDESHDDSLKQWQGFKYHARDAAVKLAQQLNIPIILGTATPSLSSLYNVHQKKYQLLSLPEPAVATQLATINVIDCRHKKIRQGLTDKVFTAVATTLQRDEQVLVFLNRRGYAPMSLCHDCGTAIQCSSCEQPLTQHLSDNNLQCHHCGKVQQLPDRCSQCASSQIISVGYGTEKIEQLLQQQFTEFPVIRIDKDSTRRKGSFDQKLALIQQQQPLIMVGTQMLAKGHDFPNVTLVVVLNIDSGLYSTDYFALENTAQLISQVAGRAGRAKKAGTVLLQTHLPEHPMFNALKQFDFLGFCKQLLLQRQQANLPPYRKAAMIRAEAHSSTLAEQFLQQIYAHLQLEELSSIERLPPHPAIMPKRAGRFRWQLSLLSNNHQQLSHCLCHIISLIETMPEKATVKWSLDVDPIEA